MHSSLALVSSVYLSINGYSSPMIIAHTNNCALWKMITTIHGGHNPLRGYYIPSQGYASLLKCMSFFIYI